MVFMVSCTHVASISFASTDAGLGELWFATTRTGAASAATSDATDSTFRSTGWLQGNSNHDPDADHGAGIYKNH